MVIAGLHLCYDTKDRQWKQKVTYEESSGLLTFHAVRGRGDKNDFLIVANLQPEFSLAIVDSSCWRGQCLLWEDHSDLCWSPLKKTAEIAWREGGRAEPFPKGRAIPKHPRKADYGSYMVCQFIEGTPLKLPINFCFNARIKI